MTPVEKAIYADAIRAAVEETRREMMLPCAACAERGEVVTRRMNTEPGECPHGYAFDCCTQCHEAFHAGRKEERKGWAELARMVKELAADHAMNRRLLMLEKAMDQKASPPTEADDEAERGAP